MWVLALGTCISNVFWFKCWKQSFFMLCDSWNKELLYGIAVIQGSSLSIGQERFIAWIPAEASYCSLVLLLHIYNFWKGIKELKLALNLIQCFNCPCFRVEDCFWTALKSLEVKNTLDKWWVVPRRQTSLWSSFSYLALFSRVWLQEGRIDLSSYKPILWSL